MLRSFDLSSCSGADRGVQRGHFTLGARCAELFRACKISTFPGGVHQEPPCTIYSMGLTFCICPGPPQSSQWPWVAASQKKGMDLVYRYAVYALYLMWTNSTCNIDKYIYIYITHSEPCSRIFLPCSPAVNHRALPQPINNYWSVTSGAQLSFYIS